MQKNILLNTLLLLGAICLLTRNVAHASEINTEYPDNGTSVAVQQNAENTQHAMHEAQPTLNPDANKTTSTNYFTEDENEEMD
ncbi:MAG: hypothetical protein AB7V32_03790 [Candidatus Berkiella sp.]